MAFSKPTNVTMATATLEQADRAATQKGRRTVTSFTSAQGLTSLVITSQFNQSGKCRKENFHWFWLSVTGTLFRESHGGKKDDRKHCQRHQELVTELLDSQQYFYSSWQKWGEQSDHFSFALRWLQVQGLWLTDWLKRGKKLYVPDNSL